MSECRCVLKVGRMQTTNEFSQFFSINQNEGVDEEEESSREQSFWFILFFFLRNIPTSIPLKVYQTFVLFYVGCFFFTFSFSLLLLPDHAKQLEPVKIARSFPYRSGDGSRRDDTPNYLLRRSGDFILLYTHCEGFSFFFFWLLRTWNKSVSSSAACSWDRTKFVPISYHRIPFPYIELAGFRAVGYGVIFFPHSLTYICIRYTMRVISETSSVKKKCYTFNDKNSITELSPRRPGGWGC